MSGRMGYKYLFSTFEIHDVPIEGAASPDGATPRNALDRFIRRNFDLKEIAIINPNSCDFWACSKTTAFDIRVLNKYGYQAIQ